MDNTQLVITCEHASHAIPKEFDTLFKDHLDELETHDAWDIGAYSIFQYLINHIESFHQHGIVSRLIIDLNRSLHNKSCFSKFTKNLSLEKKQSIIDCYYTPFRQATHHKVEEIIKSKKRCFHLSIHSFTPVLDGEVRSTDIGLLYDPKHSLEKQFCLNWKKTLMKDLMFKFNIHMNKPYKGTSDGHITALRKLYKPTEYMGIELEVNQKYLLDINMIQFFSKKIYNAFVEAYKLC